MFIIKKHYEATENNPNYAGEIKDYYEGRAGEVLSSGEFPNKWLIEEYGYKTLSGARRGLASAKELAEWETSHGFWNVSVSLVSC